MLAPTNFESLVDFSESWVCLLICIMKGEQGDFCD